MKRSRTTVQRMCANETASGKGAGRSGGIAGLLIWALLSSPVFVQNGSAQSAFIRSDANGDGIIDLADPMAMLQLLFVGGDDLPCGDAADSNDDGRIDVADAVVALGFLFVGGPRPAEPYPGCGYDPTIDELTCESVLAIQCDRQSKARRRVGKAEMQSDLQSRHPSRVPDEVLGDGRARVDQQLDGSIIDDPSRNDPWLDRVLDDSTDGAFLWRGFNHEWSYNHRLNRLGDYIKNGACEEDGGTTTCETTAVHTGASGSGPDDFEWDSFYTFVQTGSAKFYGRKETLVLSGSEGTFVSDEIEVEVETNEPNSVAVLRGFDMTAQEDADRLKKLTIRIKDEWYSRATGTFYFTLYAGGNLDCDSVECEGGDSSIEYTVKVYATVVAGDTEGFNHVQGDVIENAYDWDDYQTGFLGFDAEAELRRIDHRVRGETISGEGKNQFPNAALAFRRLTVDLDDDHHLLELDMALLPQEYDAATGTYEFDLRLFFKQWGVGMALAMYEQMDGDPALLPCSASVDLAGLCVLEDEGSAEFKATPVLLQFADGESALGSVGGTHHWEGRNASADTGDAKDKVAIVEEF